MEVELFQGMSVFIDICYEFYLFFFSPEIRSINNVLNNEIYSNFHYSTNEWSNIYEFVH